MTVIVSTDNFDTGAEILRLTLGKTEVGAVVTFTGLCRAEKGALDALVLETYQEMAKAELERIEAEARTRFILDDVFIHHRYGAFAAGDNIVTVVTLSAHRKDAFAAAEFIMDFLKTDAPFWKQSVKGDEKVWVEAKQSDDEAKARW